MSSFQTKWASGGCGENAWGMFSLVRPQLSSASRCPIVELGRKSASNLCSPFEGLPAEGLFHRHAGAPGTHSGGLLENGLGVEVPHDRDADGGSGERAGEGAAQPGTRGGGHAEVQPT